MLRRLLMMISALALLFGGSLAAAQPAVPGTRYVPVRLPGNPIITPAMLGADGENINGPSLIRAPDWLPNSPGKYLLYFAHHEGKYIRLAYSDRLTGPWKIHQPGVLHTEALSWNTDHIASPDVVVDDAKREIRLYFHTRMLPEDLRPSDPLYHQKIQRRPQRTFVAISRDGVNFQVRPDDLGPSYFRVWKWNGFYYALPRAASPLLRSRDGLTSFEAAPKGPFDDNVVFKSIRHVAVLVEGDELLVFYTRLGDAPEHIMLARVKMTGDWESWKAGEPVSFLRPETEYEGAHLPFTPSRNGLITHPENALRDPAIYQENGTTYLLYAIQGERGIAIAELRKVAR